MALRMDVVTDQPPAGIVDVAVDAIIAGIARSDAGQEQQVVCTARVRVLADRPGRGAGMDRVAHAETFLSSSFFSAAS